MSSTFTPNIGLEEPALGDYVNSWNVPVNANWSLIDQKLGTPTAIAVAGGALTLGVADSAYAILIFTGTLLSNQTVIIPARGVFFIANSTSGAFTLTLKASGGDAGYVLPSGARVFATNFAGGFAAAENLAGLVSQIGYTPANKAGDTFTGAVAVSAGGLTVAGGETVSTGNLTVTAGNLVVTAGSATVSAGAFTVTAGLSTLSGGATIASGATVNGGLTVASGSTSLGATTVSTVASPDNTTSAASTAFVHTEVPLVIAALAFGDVGTYVISSGGAAGVAPGSTVAGSTLPVFPSSQNSGSTTPLTGTWQYVGHGGAADANCGNLYLRVS